MAKTTGHTMRRYEGHKIYLATIAARKAMPLADNGLDLDVAPFWMACPPRGCDCAECALGESYSDSWAIYPMTIREMDLLDWEAEIADYRRDEARYLEDLMIDDAIGDRCHAELAAQAIEAWLAGATI